MLSSESHPPPRMVRVAGALIIAYGVLGLLGALAVAFLMQDAATSRRLGIGGILGGSLWVWVGIKLLQRRRWALILGRVLAVPATIILVIALAADRLALDPAVLVVRLVQISLALAIAIALFLPAVSKAFKKRPDPTQHWITSRTSPPAP